MLVGILSVSFPSYSETDTSWNLSAFSATQLYEVSIHPELGKPPVGRLHKWIITVMTVNKEPVYPARISVGGGMRGHSHGLPTQPRVVAYGGRGEYLVDGVRFNMEGVWRLSFAIESEHGNDRVDFDIVIDF